jgi:hypothetical protein
MVGKNKALLQTSANPDKNEFFSQEQVDSLRAKNFRVLG